MGETSETDFFFLTRRGRKLFDRGRNKLFREIEIREALLFSFRSLIEVVGIGDFILKKKSFVDFTPVCFCLINSSSTNSLSLSLSLRSFFAPFFRWRKKFFFFPFFFSKSMEKFNSLMYNIIIGNVIRTTFSNVLEFKSLPFQFTRLRNDSSSKKSWIRMEERRNQRFQVFLFVIQIFVCFSDVSWLCKVVG